jgi:hypothetical protein
MKFVAVHGFERYFLSVCIGKRSPSSIAAPMVGVALNAVTIYNGLYKVQRRVQLFKSKVMDFWKFKKGGTSSCSRIVLLSKYINVYSCYRTRLITVFLHYDYEYKERYGRARPHVAFNGRILHDSGWKATIPWQSCLFYTLVVT